MPRRQPQGQRPSMCRIPPEKVPRAAEAEDRAHTKPQRADRKESAQAIVQACAAGGQARVCRELRNAVSWGKCGGIPHTRPFDAGGSGLTEITATAGNFCRCRCRFAPRGRSAGSPPGTGDGTCNRVDRRHGSRRPPPKEQEATAPPDPAVPGSPGGNPESTRSLATRRITPRRATGSR